MSRDVVEHLEQLEAFLLCGNPLSVVDAVAYVDTQLAAKLLQLAEINADVLDYLGVNQQRDGAALRDELLEMRCGLVALQRIVEVEASHGNPIAQTICGSL